MAKPESKFVAKVHRQLPKSVYRQGMGLTATNGTPDVYYEGEKGILWVEYKWTDRIRETLNLNTKSSPKLSKLQIKWLDRAFDNNRNVAVIVGSPDGCIIADVPGMWEGEFETAPHVETFDNVIAFIKESCL
jgi:hypothetical protein